MKEKISEEGLVLLDIKNNYEAQKGHWNRVEDPNRLKYIENLMYEINSKRKIYLMSNADIIEVHLKENKAIAPSHIRSNFEI